MSNNKNEHIFGGVKPHRKFWQKWWFWAIVAVVILGGVFSNENSDTPIETKTETAKETETPEPETKENQSEQSDIEEEPETQPAASETNAENDASLSVYAMQGHPLLYDYLSEAHNFWDNCAEGRIDFPDNYFDDYKAGKTELIIEAYINTERGLKDHIIRSFEVYPQEMTLQEGIEVTKTFLPIDIMKKWYKKESSDQYFFKEENESIYHMLYIPTDEGKKEFDNSEKDYNYVCINIYTKNDIVNAISIGSVNSQPRTGNLNRSEITEWDYDFLK